MNSTQIFYALAVLLLSAAIWYVKKTFFSVPDEVPTTGKVYERGKGIIRYKYLADADDGSNAKKDCFKIWDDQKQKHIYTVPYPNFEADEGKIVAYEIEQGKDYGASIEVVEL